MKDAVRFLAGLLLLAPLAGAAAAERSIDKSIVVPATLDQTWDVWTTREGIVSFFAPDAKIEPKVAARFISISIRWPSPA